MTTCPFSPEGRRGALAAMAAGEVDLLIIGGGITGCGIARAAALQGLSVALVERDDFGCGTSSRSSKLVHGGLRYLLYGDFAMVRESAREREVLQRIAPHLVHPLSFLLPVRQDESLLKYRFGLWLFDRFAGIAPDARCRLLTPTEVAERIPGLFGPLKGGLLYRECLTDDARFTLENAQSAAEHGALVANHAPVLELTRDNTGSVTGAVLKDDLTGVTHRVRARLTVNATGPWAAQTMELGGTKAPKALLPSKGIHLVFSADRLQVEGAVVLNAPSGRSGFAIRRWGLVYVGTTDVAYRGPMDRVTADSEAVADLLALVRECFPGCRISRDDVLGTWAGLRPLIAEPGKSPRDTSRHDEVWTGPEGLLTIAGGKLTTYRSMARRVMSHVEQTLGLPPGDPNRTAEAPLPGARMPHRLPPQDLPAATRERLTWLYGAQLDDLLALGDADPAWLEPLAPGVPALRGEVRHAVEQEMAATLPDFLDRRAALLLFSPDHGVSAADEASRIMAALLGWSETERLQQVEQYEALAAAHGHL